MKKGGEFGPRGILLATALAAVALAGCPRVPETRPPPTPTAASGEPRPSAIEAEIQRRVQATVTAQATTPDIQVLVPNSSIGNVTRGSKLFVQKGCVACHMLTGMKEAIGTIGPDLTGVATRPRIPSSTGEVKNTPEEMRRWLMNPASIKSSTIMPPLGLTDAEAQDIVSFLTQSAPQPPKPGQQAAKPAEAQKPAGGEKATIRLKPEELSRVLLTTPVQSNELPAGFTSRGNLVGELDETAQSLKAVAQRKMFLEEKTTAGEITGFGELNYTVFPSSSAAKDAYAVVAMRSGTKALKDFDSPTIVSPGLRISIITTFDNVLVVASYFANDLPQHLQENKTIALIKAGLAHLQKVGR